MNQFTQPRLIVSAWTTLDGMIASEDDSMDWLRPDRDLMQYETELAKEAGTLLLGRVTHADFASYWPAVAKGEIEADEGSRNYARRLDELDKVVVSRAGEFAVWEGSRRIADLSSAEVARIKQESQGHVVVYGSLSVVEVLDRLGLIDEVHVVVHPTFLGRGKRLFPDGSRTPLELQECRTFSSGAVLMRLQTRVRPGAAS